MAGRHRVVAPNRPLTREVGRVGALLLLTTAPLVQVGTASAAGASGPVQERRTQTDDSNRDSRDRDSRDRDSRDRDSRDRDSRDRESSDERDSDDDRRSGTRNASSRQRSDSSRAEDGGYRGRHRADDDDDDDDDEDRGSTRTRSAATSADGSSRKSRARSAESIEADGSSRKSRTRSALTSDDDRPRSRSRTVRAAEDSATSRRGRAEAAVSGRVPESRWDRLAQCESRQRWAANTGNGYRGGLQFSDSTWRAYGGARYAPSAHQASREEQIAVASKVQREQGWSAWPSCSRKLGYT